MIAAEDVARFADKRPECELIAYADVGLPYWRVRTRAELLERKPLSPIQELVMRAVRLGVPDRSDLLVLLGLPPTVLDAAVAMMLVDEWVKEDGQERLALTQAGTEIEQAAYQERSEERPIEFDYDGLLRRPAIVPQPLSPAQLASGGAREIAPNPLEPPDLGELQQNVRGVERLVKVLMGGREREIDLLAIKRVIRRDRAFREAALLVFELPDEGGYHAAFVVDDALSLEHEQAFAQGDLLSKLELAHRPKLPFAALIAPSVKARFDAASDKSIRAALREARVRADAAHDDEGRKQAEADLQAAMKTRRELDLRIAECYEQSRLLDVAVRGAFTKLAIISPRITGAVVDGDFVKSLRLTLERGVAARFVHSKTGGIDDDAARKLASVARDYPDRFELVAVTHVPKSALLRDDSLLLVTHFPLLSHRGDGTRPLVDERGWVITDAGLVAEECAAWPEVLR